MAKRALAQWTRELGFALTLAQLEDFFHFAQVTLERSFGATHSTQLGFDLARPQRGRVWRAKSSHVVMYVGRGSWLRSRHALASAEVGGEAAHRKPRRMRAVGPMLSLKPQIFPLIEPCRDGGQLRGANGVNCSRSARADGVQHLAT